jgi:hypothetical protein
VVRANIFVHLAPKMGEQKTIVLQIGQFIFLRAVSFSPPGIFFFKRMFLKINL